MPSDEWKEMNRKSLLREKKEFLVDLIEQGNEELERAYARLRAAEANPPKSKRKVFVTMSADLWPPQEWLRVKVDTDFSGGYWQAAIGPIRLDVFE